jgi:hypothetical protein
MLEFSQCSKATLAPRRAFVESLQGENMFDCLLLLVDYCSDKNNKMK